MRVPRSDQWSQQLQQIVLLVIRLSFPLAGASLPALRDRSSLRQRLLASRKVDQVQPSMSLAQAEPVAPFQSTMRQQMERRLVVLVVVAAELITSQKQEHFHGPTAMQL